jgi:membrane protein implicated in regulation of membrane protease activity
VEYSWVWWLIAAAALVVGELFTGTFVLLMLAAGAFVAAIVGVAGGGIIAELLTFAIVSTLALGLARKPMKDFFFRKSHKVEFGLEAIVGASAIVVDRVDAESGQVRIGGELWRARPATAGDVLEPGERVRVIEVRGATALVGKDQE